MAAIGRFVGPLVTGLPAGIPMLAGIAIESAVIAWVLEQPRWFGDPGFGATFALVFGVQARIVCLFADE